MDVCRLCERPIEGPRLIDRDSGDGWHAACAAGRLPQDTIVALIAAAALVLVPNIIVWAG